MSSDIAVSVSNRVPVGSPISNKPSYLVALEENSGKSRLIKYFITLDRPEQLDGFIQVKGVFADPSLQEAEIIKTFSDILTSAKKELILELWLPWHKICSIRSLVFKAK